MAIGSRSQKRTTEFATLQIGAASRTFVATHARLCPDGSLNSSLPEYCCISLRLHGSGLEQAVWRWSCSSQSYEGCDNQVPFLSQEGLRACHSLWSLFVLILLADRCIPIHLSRRNQRDYWRKTLVSCEVPRSRVVREGKLA